MPLNGRVLNGLLQEAKVEVVLAGRKDKPRVSQSGHFRWGAS